MLTLFGGLIAYYSTNFFSSGYQHSQLFLLTSAETDSMNNQNSNLEEYYMGENSRNFTDTAVGILESGDFQSEILKAPESLTVKKVAPQLIRLTFTTPVRGSTSLQLEKVSVLFNEKLKDIYQGSSSAMLKPVVKAQEPTYSALNKYVLFAAGSLIGTIFALFILGLKVYLRL